MWTGFVTAVHITNSTSLLGTIASSPSSLCTLSSYISHFRQAARKANEEKTKKRQRAEEKVKEKLFHSQPGINVNHFYIKLPLYGSSLGPR